MCRNFLLHPVQTDGFVNIVQNLFHFYRSRSFGNAILIEGFDSEIISLIFVEAAQSKGCFRHR